MTKKAERYLAPSHGYGPAFYEGDGKTWFVHRIDASNAIGPREATRLDKEHHPTLWAEHQAMQTEVLNKDLKKKAK